MSEVWQWFVDLVNSSTQATRLFVFGAFGTIISISFLIIVFKIGSKINTRLLSHRRNPIYKQRTTFDLSFAERRRMIARMDGERIPFEHLPKNIEENQEPWILCLCGGFFLPDAMFCSNCGRNRNEGKDDLAEMWGND